MKALGSSHYDMVYKDSKKYRIHYKFSIYYDVWKMIVDCLKKLDDPIILEIGCGTGQLAHLLYDEGFQQYFGFDFSREAISIANKQRFFVGNAYDKTIYDKFLHNTIVACEVFEHLDDDIDVIKKLKKGANIIFSLPTFNCNGHVRWFKTVESIDSRYKDYIAIKDIFRVKSWFVCTGKVK